MKRDAAIRLISQTFDHPFDAGQFGRLASNILNEVDRGKAFMSRHGQYIPDAFKGHIRQYKRPFVYTDPNGERLDVLVVRLHKESSLERARTMQRNFVSWYLKQNHAEAVEAALVAFYHDDVPDWRFSLLRLEYAFGEEGVEEKLTPARRYSYLVGPTEPTHTAEQQLLPFLLDDAANPTIDDLATAFQIETVSKRFFEAYKELFLKLVEAIEETLAHDQAVARDFERAGIHLPSFAKKLLGQIVFLYFIQKKGWLGVEPDEAWGSGPRDFLRRLFARSQAAGGDFFNDTLEPLFYDALALQRRGDRFTLNGYTTKIPFLNGGLFEPMGGYDWRHTNLALPNALFSHRKDQRDDSATGILDVFDRYNFTVWEEEPLEKEVAVDPEMLGKVFENLLEVQDRKSKGAFYTPREIVHYMCQESLINYLDTAVNGDKEMGREGEAVPREAIVALVRRGDLALQQDAAKEAGLKSGDYVLPEAVRTHAAVLDKALAEIKLCDPAIGSGAFPVAMLHEIVQARQALAIYLHPRPEQRPTPYDLKRHAIQESIYGVDIDAGAVEIAKLRLWLSLVVDEERYDAIQPLPNLDYKIVQGNSLGKVKRDLLNLGLFDQLDALKRRYFDETHPREKTKLRAQIEQLIGLLIHGKQAFDFQIYFHEVFEGQGGFDVVIGNPPYGADFSEDDKAYLKLRFDYISERIRNSFLYFTGLAYEISRRDGVICLILPNEFLFQIYMTKARRFFLNEAQFLFAVNVGEDVFEAIVPTCIVGIKKSKKCSYSVPIADLRDCSLQELSTRLDTRTYQISSSNIIRSTPNSIISFDLERALLISRLTSKFPSFEHYCDDVANGISTSCDEIYIVSDDLVMQWDFESEYLKPCIRGGQFTRYYCPPNTSDFVLYITTDFDPKIGKNIYRYLSENRELLIQKSVEKRKGKRQWHLLFRARKENLFRKPKIIIRQTGDRIVAAVDDQVGYYCIDSVNVALVRSAFSQDIYFFTGLLNSSLLNFFYREISQEKGRVLAQVKPQRIKALPISMGTEFYRTEISNKAILIASLVSTHDYTKDTEKQSDIFILKSEIDQLVYRLYDLTEEEIALIETDTKR